MYCALYDIPCDYFKIEFDFVRFQECNKMININFNNLIDIIN